ncbi:MAG: hypothetical protein IJW63_05315 [Lachnospiraceae bacterium]|nr:hypothetical protein [Lachnospiraceae bacterium]
MDLKELKLQAKFQKKDILFSEVLGVCRVDELTRLSTQKGDMILYYGLRSIADQTKVSYVPVENHSVLLRELISVEQAKEFLAKVEADMQAGGQQAQDGEAAEISSDAAQSDETDASVDPLLLQEARYVLKHFG